MKIVELHIYGYGKLENYKLESLQNLQILYGENEAGKSTIMSFIQSVLFGFPTRQQAELRYEPKHHSKYGGMIKAEFHGIGTAVIERVKGKSSGDVTVLLDNGETGGEDLLQKLLGSIDKGLFQSIFSFNLQGLQNVQGIKGEDLGRYLFSAGTLGTDSLFQAEGILEKEMEKRFKPGGRRPSINEQLRELRQLHTNLKKAEEQNDRYQALEMEHEDLEGEIARLSETEDQLLKQAKDWEEARRLLPIILEEEKLNQELSLLGEISFPVDGIQRLDRLDQHLKPIEARLAALYEREEVLRNEAQNVYPDFSILESEAEIHSTLQRISDYEHFERERQELHSKAENLFDEIERNHDQLNLNLDEESLAAINTSVFVRDKAEELQKRYTRLLDKKQELEDDFQSEKTVLEELEHTVVELKGQLLSEQEHQVLSKKIIIYDNKNLAKQELEQIRSQIKNISSRYRMEHDLIHQHDKKVKQQQAALGILFSLLFLYGFLQPNWVIAGAGLAGLLFLFISLVQARKMQTPFSASEAPNDLYEREKELSEQVNEMNNGDETNARVKLSQDQMLREQVQLQSIRLSEQNKRYEKRIKAFELWELEYNNLEQEILKLGNELCLPEEISRKHIYDAYLLIDKQKGLYRERKRARERADTLASFQQELTTSVSKLAKKFLKEPALPIQEAAISLRKRVKEESENLIKYEETKKKQSETEEEKQTLEEEKRHLSQERAALFKEAFAETEDQYRKAANMAAQKREWKRRISDISFQLSSAQFDQQVKKGILEGVQVDLKINSIKKTVLEIKAVLADRREKLASVKHQMRILEEGGLYGDLLHKFKQQRHEFEEEAKVWGRYALAREVLSKTIEQYKTERLPQMLSKAEEYLLFLTSGKYKRIIPLKEGSGFQIEREDHTLFYANELSQATTEQVYVSLRLALAVTVYGNHAFPILIDDSFVNFDHNRTRRILELLKGLPNNQVIFFTCHSHLTEQFERSQIIELNGLGSKLIG
ncbi:ATP-binding protein [Mesobacillus harenae]|uniref:ATP-binding protein n=1 Tax=Mesobacillus harenae TaxID=2213203 RepID=UPI0015804C05|nr:AAA family ATPase [Mesobacillus harenae]